MEIRIGVQNNSREVVLESDQSAEAVSTIVKEALGGAVLDLSDSRGRRVMIPTAALAYVEIGTEERHRVGFGG